MRISLQQKIGANFGKCFTFKGRYLIVKGSRNSKKSYNLMQFKPILDILSNELNNVLILRAIDKDNRQSTFSLIKRGLRELGIKNYFKINETDMTIKYKPTGQIIFFRGCNDPESLTSLSVEVGILNKLYIEEAFQIKDYQTFRQIDGSFRGQCPYGIYFQITMIFNPWVKSHWLYDEFFKGRLEDDYNALLEFPKMEYINEEEVIGFGKGLYLMTCNYKINEFRDTSTWDVAMDRLRQVAPEIFKVEGLGMWGSSRDKCYSYWNDKLVIPHAELMYPVWQYASYTIGIDFGMGNGEGKVKLNTKEQPYRYRSGNAMSLCAITSDYSKMVTLQDWFYSNQGKEIKKTSVEIAEDMIKEIIRWKELYKQHATLMKGLIICYVDNADSGGFRNLLQAKALELGLINIQFLPSSKNITIQNRVDFYNLMMAYGDYVISDRCVNLKREIENAHGSASGLPREDCDDHNLNSNEYGFIPMIPRLMRWKEFKER